MKFQHDSDCCTFLGTLDGVDMYFCDVGKPATVLARFSDEGPDYVSGIPIAQMMRADGTLNVKCGTASGTKEPGEKIEIDPPHRALRVALLIAYDNGLVKDTIAGRTMERCRHCGCEWLCPDCDGTGEA